MNILILGESSDEHAAHINQFLQAAGATVDYFNTSMFPTQIQMSWNPTDREGYLQLSDKRQLKLNDIKSVYWRNFSGVKIPDLEQSSQKTLAFNDSMSAMRTILKGCSAKWVNSWQAYQFHKEKPLQLARVKQLGVKIPETLITNNSEQAIAFTKSQKKLIFKPVYGGAHTQVLTDTYLAPERLKLALSISPVTLQEYIVGTNIRTYVIGNSVYSAEIRSNSTDFREDSTAELIPLKTPETIKKQCLKITNALHLKWTAIDWRRNCLGEYFFLEANPSPMFIYFERQTGFPLTKKLVELLMS